MRKLLISLLILACLSGTALAAEEVPMEPDPRVVFSGIVEEMASNGSSFSCLSSYGEQFQILITPDTVIKTAASLTPGMIVDILTEENIDHAGSSLHALEIRDAVYEVYVHEIDPDYSRVRAGSMSCQFEWLELPAGTDLDALMDKNIRFTPISIPGVPIYDSIQAESFETFSAIAGDVIERGDGYLVINQQSDGGPLRVWITDDTVTFRLIDNAESVQVSYQDITEGDPPEVTALTIWIAYG